jgi:hypothetical protein
MKGPGIVMDVLRTRTAWGGKKLIYLHRQQDGELDSEMSGISES